MAIELNRYIEVREGDTDTAEGREARIFDDLGLRAMGGSRASPLDPQGRTCHGDTTRISPADILVVIPTLNEADHIEACLRSLCNGDDDLKTIRFVIADGGSTDRTREIVAALVEEFPNIMLVDNPGRVQSMAVNLVAETLATPCQTFMVRCDAHSIYPRDYVLDVARHLRDRGTASLVVPMDAEGETCFGRAAAWIVDTPFGSGGSAHRGGTRSKFVDHGHHAGFVLDWFRKVGGYDPAFSHNEDAEYDYRIASVGGKTWLETDIRIAYKMRPTLGRLGVQYYLYGKGRARTVLKHRMRPKPRQIAPAVLFIAMAASLLLSLISPLFLLFAASYIATLMGISGWMALRRKSGCGLLSGVALGTMHLCWGAGFVLGMLFGRFAPQSPSPAS